MPVHQEAWHRPGRAGPTATLECHAFPGMRVELWAGQPDESWQHIMPVDGEADALRFHLADCGANDGMADGVPDMLPACPRGSCSFLDYAPRHQWRGAEAGMIVFRMSKTSLVAWAHQNGHPRFAGLRYCPGIPFNDAVIANLALAMHSSLADEGSAAPAFTGMMFGLVLAYLIETFGITAPDRHRGGLARWQMRAVERFVSNRLESQIRLSELAELSGLSVSYFVKAFRVTVGLTPHQWLIARRVDRARELLGTECLALADIAASCGFADQSHFTRMFSKIAGVSPGLWRKQAKSVARLARQPCTAIDTMPPMS